MTHKQRRRGSIRVMTQRCYGATLGKYCLLNAIIAIHARQDPASVADNHDGLDMDGFLVIGIYGVFEKSGRRAAPEVSLRLLHLYIPCLLFFPEDHPFNYPLSPPSAYAISLILNMKPERRQLNLLSRKEFLTLAASALINQKLFKKFFNAW